MDRYIRVGGRGLSSSSASSFPSWCRRCSNASTHKTILRIQQTPMKYRPPSYAFFSGGSLALLNLETHERKLETLLAQQYAGTLSISRYFSSSSSSKSKKTKKQQRSNGKEEKESDLLITNRDDPGYFRCPGIQFHENSVSQYIFPDMKVLKRPFTADQPIDTTKRIGVEFEFGSFWMLREMRDTNDKPILANNDELIPQEVAQEIPPLIVTSVDTNQDVVLPEHFIQQNRSNDPAAQCTVLALISRQYGSSLVPTWIQPIQEYYGGNKRVQTAVVTATEGGWVIQKLAPFLKWLIRRNITNEVERKYTYLCYDTENKALLDEFRIKLGCHNIMTCYVFLLDGLGQLRWAASGAAQDEELQALIHKHIPKLLPRKQSRTK